MNIFLFLLLLFIPLCFSYKILIFAPTISRSHMISNGRIGDELALAGHNVTLFEPDFLSIWDKVDNTKHAKRWKVDGFSDAMWKAINGFSTSFTDDSLYTSTVNIVSYQRAFNKLCGELLDRKDVIEALRKEKFDAFFGEQLNGCGNGLAHLLGLEIQLWISSCPIMDHMSYILGIPAPTSYIPSVGNVDISNKPSYIERIQNTVEHLANVYSWGIGFGEEATEEFRKRFDPSFPLISEIVQNSDVIFVATDEFVDFPRPILQNVIHIGGLGVTDDTKPLPESFSEEMTRGSKGVVFFSLGSNVNTSSVPKEAMTTVFNVFSKFPDYHFIAKVDHYDKNSWNHGHRLSNVFITEWAPQKDLLQHPRLLAMIGHGGYNSMMECARAGVPMITIPFFIDQYRNGRAAELHGWGVPVSRKDLLNGGNALEKALDTVLHDKSYGNNARRISKLIKSRPFSASEKLVKWTEFVISNGGMKELLVEGRKMSFVQYHNLDIFIPILIVFQISIFAFVKFLCLCLCSQRKTVKVKKH